MTTLGVTLPDSLHRTAEELAAREGISVDQFVAAAVAEKVGALMTERAMRGSRERFEAVLAQVPDTEPDESDGL